MTKMLPDFRPAKVTIKLKNAQILSHSVTTNKGDWQDPYCAQDLEEKFYSLAERTINRNKSEMLYNRLMALEKSKDIRDLFHRICRIGRNHNRSEKLYAMTTNEQSELIRRD